MHHGNPVFKPTESIYTAMSFYKQNKIAEQVVYGTEKEKLDTNNCMGDIQLPRYTRIKDEEGNYIFENKEIAVTSDNTKVIAINGYRTL